MIQGRMPGMCLVEDCTIADGEVGVVEEDISMITDFNDIAELASGYGECMEEAIRYLTEVENYPQQHPAVEALRCHLNQYRQQLLQLALYRTSGIGHGIY